MQTDQKIGFPLLILGEIVPDLYYYFTLCVATTLLGVPSFARI